MATGIIKDFQDLDPNGTYTYADYLLWQFQERVELIKGKIFKMSPAPLRKHQEIQVEILTQIYNFLKGNPCKVYGAPFDVRLPGRNQLPENQVQTVVQPDICVVCDLTKLDERGCNGAPDLVIEIISVGSAKRDLDEKFHLYEQSGVKEYWIVFPLEKQVSVYVLVGSEFQLTEHYQSKSKITSGNLVGFSLDLGMVFED